MAHSFRQPRSTHSGGHVDIFMSTYNGARYLQQQLDSIVRQDYDDWTLFIRDDGSGDATLSIIASFAALDPRIRLLDDDAGNLGAARSFMRLLAGSQAPYFMFADQDDVWLPNKVSLTLGELKRREHDPDRPLLVYTDLQVVDEELSLISPSFLKFQRLKPSRFTSFRREMLQNIVTGCALGGNAALRNKSLLGVERHGDGMVMHDWWLALVASCFGEMACIDHAPILYRQHANNHLGAKGSGFTRYLTIMRDMTIVGRVENLLNRVSRQARLFVDTFGSRISVSDRELLMYIAGAENRWTASVAFKCICHGAGFKTLDCALGVLLLLLLRPLLVSRRKTGIAHKIT